MSADPEVTREMEPPTYTVLGETLAQFVSADLVINPSQTMRIETSA